MPLNIYLLYRKLFAHFGPQNWWPAQGPFEVIVGAILTQGTSWKNVEKAIGNLKKNKLLHPAKLQRLSHKKLAALIRPAGYYNIKAERLKAFLDFFSSAYRLSVKNMAQGRLPVLRRNLLAVKGIGPETADSILLYALRKPVFVVDAYTRRILLRHGLIKEGAVYADIRNLFMQNLKKEVKLFNEYHALLVKLGKELCRKSKPRCAECPINQGGLKCARNFV